ncbi:carbon-monoxide dehydrogenase small subunit [Treponema bryantii]|uniref:Carbon-monoxide dehydrogenase small subunit n=1 Tax=Treponema bryantii TaxID=163 RepID=A0A1H9A6Y0_9SPIR|nr:2Fe-2S iron-sulfur cluster-binding protein [Treponema bryantii]BDC93781.1 (2Fe-2S)-binding protein [Treponema bryantii]SEP72385.1 carbon-monoxide dehydrogenase small subunit [Treponema bryantii]
MKIPVTLNGNKIILDAHADETLMKVLHKNGCTSVKSGCSGGFCGACTILLDDRPVASCKIPAGIVRNSDIVTLDYFVKTEEYITIISGFQKAGIKLCGYCTAGKVFSAYQIMKMPKMPTRQEITDYVKALSPCCTDLETLVNGIIYAIQISNKRQKRT